MSDLKPLAPRISVQEYLDGETVSDVRHEYVDGEVYAMAGGTLTHNRIALNIGAALDDALDGSSRRPYIGDVKVRVETLETETFYYPDVVVTCQPDDNNPLYLERPTTIFEVLSESTERLDRNEKFLAYRSLPTLEDYVLVSQVEKRITVARRANGWQAELLDGDGFSLEVACCDVPLEAGRIYRNVDFSD